MKKLILIFSLMVFGFVACDDDDSNNSNNNNVCADVTCQTNATCDATTGDCVCDSGYTIDGTECVEDSTDLCATVDCQPNATCNETNGNCECDTGYTLDGTECTLLFALNIVVVGEASAITFTDGNAGQTPTNYFMGMQRFDLMKSAGDLNPVTVFDYDASYIEVDMTTTNNVAQVDLTTIPIGLYTHGRVLLTMTRFDVDTIVHSTLSDLSGTMSVVGALSDCNIDGTARTQDWAEYTFNVAGGITQPGTLPPMPSTAGGTIIQEGGNTWMVFPLSENLNILPIPNQSKTATIWYNIFESFRWTDSAVGGYATDVFDSESDGSHETVTNFGAVDYLVTVE
jgi:hypothetical protein